MKFDQQYLNLYFDLQNLEAFRRACNISTFISRYAVFLMRFDDERSRLISVLKIKQRISIIVKNSILDYGQ